MGGATFGRITNWVTQVLTSAALDAEFNNILNNLNPSGLDGYSDTTGQMQIQTSPGGLGSESLATSLAGEVARLRYVIAQLIGSSVTYWYQAPSNTLTSLAAAIGSTLPANRITSGITRTTSSQMLALIAAGNTASVTLTASASTPFAYEINNAAYSIIASTSLGALGTAAGTTSAQCLVATNANLTGNIQSSQWLGQYGTAINIMSAGATLASQVGNLCGFSLSESSGTVEYFLGYLSSTTQITNAWRGAFFNATSQWVVPQAVNQNNTISLLKLAWLFINT